MNQDEFHFLLPKLRRGYRPAPSVLEHIGKLKLLIVVGPSGAGKTTIMRGLDLPYVVSDTSRVQRLHEQNGVDYNFRLDFSAILEDIRRCRFVQFEVGPAGDFYGTRDSAFPLDGSAVIAVVAHGVDNFRKLGFAKTATAFIVPQSYEEFIKRLDNQELDDTSRSRRIKEAEQSIEWALADDQTHFILNDKVDDAAIQAKDILAGKVDRPREVQAKHVAAEIYNHLSKTVK